MTTQNGTGTKQFHRLAARARQTVLLAITGATDGCCSCGDPRRPTRRYFGACDAAALGLDPSRADWEACEDCHNADTPHGVFLRSLRSELVR